MPIRWRGLVLLDEVIGSALDFFVKAFFDNDIRPGPGGGNPSPKAQAGARAGATDGTPAFGAAG